jgi:cytochrome c-type biogenesis protein CcmE
MKNLKKQRRVQIILVAVVSLTLSTALIGYALRDGINYFRAPSQVVEMPPPPGEVFRTGGLVQEGSLIIGESEQISFVVTDGGATIPVTYTGIRPDLFGEGEGVVATGRYVDGIFQATEILAKHDETYMPKEVIDALKEQGVYQEPES